MTREHLARLALLAYPRGVRTATGEEMIGTLLDASGQSKAAYARELAALVGNGLRARSAPRAQPSAARLIADGFCYAGVALLALAAAELVGVSVQFHQTLAHSTQVWHLLLLGGCLSAALIGYDRIAAAGALAWMAMVITAPYRGSAVGPLVALEALPILCFAVMLIMPRYQARRVRRAAWLMPIAALGSLAAGVGPSSYLVLAPLAIAVPVALARVARDPRLAIACSLLGLDIAMFETTEALQGRPLPIGLPLTVLLFSATPLVIAFTARRAHAQHPGDAA